MSMSCKGKCSDFRALRPKDHDGRYIVGQKRCQTCSMFLNWEGLWCPCCGYKLRTRPRSTKYKTQLTTMTNKNTEKKNLIRGESVDVFEKDSDGIMIRVGMGKLLNHIQRAGKYEIWQVELKNEICNKFILA